MSMLSDVPFTRTVDSQTGGIHNHVTRPTARTDGQGRRQGTLSSTDSAVVWNWKIESQQLQEQRNKALRRPKAKLKHRLQHQCALDGRVRNRLSERRDPCAGQRCARRRRRSHRTKRSGYLWRSAPDCSLASCAMQGGGELPWEVICRGVVDGIAMVIHMTRREGRRFVEEAAYVKGYDAKENSWEIERLERISLK